MNKRSFFSQTYLVFYIFIFLTKTPSLWAVEEVLSHSLATPNTDASPYQDFERELKSIESAEQLEKLESKAIEEKEMMAELITDEVQNEQSSLQRKTIQESNQEMPKKFSEEEKILPTANILKKRRVRSR